jgi:hypothetical protein
MAESQIAVQLQCSPYCLYLHAINATKNRLLCKLRLASLFLSVCDCCKKAIPLCNCTVSLTVCTCLLAIRPARVCLAWNMIFFLPLKLAASARSCLPRLLHAINARKPACCVNYDSPRCFCLSVTAAKKASLLCKQRLRSRCFCLSVIDARKPECCVFTMCHSLSVLACD